MTFVSTEAKEGDYRDITLLVSRPLAAEQAKPIRSTDIINGEFN